MQRLFTSFPGGPPGLGLLLLRSTLGAVGAFEAGTLLNHDGWAAIDAIAIACAAAAGLVVLGLLTPVAGASLGLSPAACWLASRTPAAWFDGSTALLVVGTGAAIALLGPGAYSVDARLFGRREIVVDLDRPPRRSRLSP